MKLKMKSNSSTRGFAILLILAYAIYGLFMLGLPTLLMSMAAALVFYGFTENLELSAGVMIIVGMIVSRAMKRYSPEGFEDGSGNKVAAEAAPEAAKPAAEAPKAAPEAPKPEEPKPSGSDKPPGQKDTFVDINPAPVDSKGGFYIDQGTTLLNALNGLKPDQISSMTNDTKQLIETQKSLMGMLNNLAPMMKEGSNLMSMFNGMFGGQKTQ